MERKRDKDARYYASPKGYRNRARKCSTAIGRAINQHLADWIESGAMDAFIAWTGGEIDAMSRDAFQEVLRQVTGERCIG